MRPDDAERLRASLASRWWALVLRGALSMLFSGAMLVWPDVSLVVLVLFVGAWLFADGLLALTVALGRGRDRLQILEGAAGAAIGLLAILHPNVNGLTLLVIVAVWAIATGVLRMLLAMDLGSRRRGAWIFAAIGAASLLFGALLLSNLASGALAVLGLIAGFAMLLGLAYVSTGFWLERSNGATLSHELPPRENRDRLLFRRTRPRKLARHQPPKK